jgi:hypothetical protein
LCYCIFENKKQEEQKGNVAKGVVDGVFNALKAATYQLDAKDPLHKIDLNKFYKDH